MNGLLAQAQTRSPSKNPDELVKQLKQQQQLFLPWSDFHNIFVMMTWRDCFSQLLESNLDKLPAMTCSTGWKSRRRFHSQSSNCRRVNDDDVDEHDDDDVVKSDSFHSAKWHILPLPAKMTHPLGNNLPFQLWCGSDNCQKRLRGSYRQNFLRAPSVTNFFYPHCAEMEPVSPEAAHLGFHFYSNHFISRGPLGTWLRTLHWWISQEKKEKEEEKSPASVCVCKPTVAARIVLLLYKAQLWRQVSRTIWLFNTLCQLIFATTLLSGNRSWYWCLNVSSWRMADLSQEHATNLFRYSLIHNLNQSSTYFVRTRFILHLLAGTQRFCLLTFSFQLSLEPQSSPSQRDVRSSRATLPNRFFLLQKDPASFLTSLRWSTSNQLGSIETV